ncbi:C4-dicarboxylate ABC transporter substrate-binding protein [Iodidimonas nitroreducens]|uniref:C4-dicarboxylate ABC transporter substrate-binding protein n=1 Tax=Iodidimonas nitroreducens TaxID=1236968 RepID=A0A5A7N4R5_9PROT|nr:TRAP transporter substrate-binding protein [Iodidimonas nitroreducens]GAK33842.1 sialic acid-binding periplasmic protein SiaP [alpha proteobacterium Q-1]GER03273.1 C4-dicarboxylate ABC transporter substrate-binding protein [Iodidimonas nitroreducens]
MTQNRAMSLAQILQALMLIMALSLLTFGLSRLVERPAAPLDLSLPWGAEEFHVKNARLFAQSIRERTHGRVEIALHPGAVLGIKGPGSLRAARDHLIAMVEMGGFQQVGEAPILGLDALPFLVRDQQELQILYEDFRPIIKQTLARHGMQLLYAVPWPAQNIYADRPFHKLADFKGQKVRTIDANTTDLARSLGMAPIQMASADVVPALATGSLDAVMTSTTTGVAQKYWQFLSHIHRTNHGWLTNLMVINDRALARLSPEDQQALFDLAQDMEPDFWAVSKADDQEKLARLKAEGMRIIIPDVALQSALEEQARPLWAAFAQRVPGSAPIINRFLIRTHRAPLDLPIKTMPRQSTDKDRR